MGLDIDEWIYGQAVRFWNIRKKKALNQTHVVSLESVKPRLTLMARALTGNPVEIFTAEAEGGWKGNNFFLPVSMGLFDLYEDNLKFYFYRLVFLSIQRELNLNWNHSGQSEFASRLEALNSAPEILRKMQTDYPQVTLLHDSLKELISRKTPAGKPEDYTLLYGKWMYNPPTVQDPNIHAPAPVPATPAVNPTTTLQARAVEEIRSLTPDKKQQEDYVMTHNFEKVETAEEANGVWRDFDGSDELKDHQNALDEIKMSFTVRTDDPVHSVLQTDFLEHVNLSESREQEVELPAVFYPEWDYRKRRYKENFCRVCPVRPEQINPEEAQNILRQHSSRLMALRKALVSMQNKRTQVRRQIQGESFDLDAITTLATDIQAGVTPDERIYLSSRKREQDISILFLLDASLSSDGYASNNRIIEVARQTAILTGEILQEMQIDFSIAAFYSRTRNYTQYSVLKDFEESWTKGKPAVAAIEPCGYTRIGAALRHAGAQLSLRPFSNRWVILLSDGKPNDFDVYEGRYGMEDTRQALRELNAQHMQAYALAIEAQAKYYLPLMFGQNHYQILPGIEELVGAVTRLVEKIRNR